MGYRSAAPNHVGVATDQLAPVPVSLSPSLCRHLHTCVSYYIFLQPPRLYIWAQRALQWCTINPNFLSSYLISSLSACLPFLLPSLPYTTACFIFLLFISSPLCSFSSFSSIQTDLESLDPRGRTPLHLAVTLGYLDCARVLLQQGADVSKENRNGWTGECVCVFVLWRKLSIVLW